MTVTCSDCGDDFEPRDRHRGVCQSCRIQRAADMDNQSNLARWSTDV